MREIHDNHTSEGQKGTFCLNLRLGIVYFHNPWYSFLHYRNSQNQNALSISSQQSGARC